MLSFSVKKRVIYIFSILLVILVLIFSCRFIIEKDYQYNLIYKDEINNKIKDIAADTSLPVKKDVSMIFGGDIMLSRTVNKRMSDYNDYAWPARLIASSTNLADITIFNLESPFLKDSTYSVASGSFSFKANPLSVGTLTLLGADVVSLANNHMLNAGRQGLVDTIDILKENNINSIGAGLNDDAARAGVVLEVNGWKIAFLAYAYPQDSSIATDERAGIANMNLEDLKIDIKRLKNKSDLVIVLMHAGVEYVSQANKEQINFAHSAIDYGADAVIGHHPHWPQNWEIYKDKPIFYSLGNFIFDQMWSQGTSQGVLAELIFREDLSGSAKLIPIIIKDYGQVDLLSKDIDESYFWSAYNLIKPEQINW